MIYRTADQLDCESGILTSMSMWTDQVYDALGWRLYLGNSTGEFMSLDAEPIEAFTAMGD
jgi:hypothetical protein